MTAYISMALYLGTLSVMDIRSKRIYNCMFIVGIVPVLIACITNESFDPFGRFLGVLSGTVILILAVLTKEKIGKGDAVIFMLTGAAVGIAENLAVIGTAFLLAGLLSAVLLPFKALRLKQHIAFVPFILAAYLFVEGLLLSKC